MEVDCSRAGSRKLGGVPCAVRLFVSVLTARGRPLTTHFPSVVELSPPAAPQAIELHPLSVTRAAATLRAQCACCVWVMWGGMGYGLPSSVGLSLQFTYWHLISCFWLCWLFVYSIVL